MKIRIMIMMLCVLAFTSAAFAQKGNGGTAVPAGTATFDGGNCTAKFVRSASGIINETNRSCQPGDPFAGAVLQFRPVNGTPNPNCDPDGLLVPQFQFRNYEQSLAPWFGPTANPTLYNVCVYLTQPTQSGSIDVTGTAGTNVTLPATGSYSICITGTYDLNDGIIGDAAYLLDTKVTDQWTKGSSRYPEYLGNLGNVLVDGNPLFSALAYNVNHRYCTTINGTKGQSLNLSVNDPYAVNNSNIDLGYTVKFLGY